MIKSHIQKTAVLASILALSACGGAAATPETSAGESKPAKTESSAPTAPKPAAEKAVEPAPKKAEATSKPVDTPKPTDAPAKAAVAAGPLSKQIGNYKQAKSYRAEMTVSISGDMMDMPIKDSGKTPLMSFRGAFNGKDSQVTMGGMLVALMGADPEKGMQTVQIGADTYVLGPLSTMGIKDANWYKLPTDQANGVISTFSPEDFLKDFSDDATVKNVFKPTGSETIGAQTCTVYTADKEALQKEDNGGMGKDFERVDSAEANVVTCPDGYMHRFEMNIAGSPKGDATKKGAMSLSIKMSDFDAVAPITAPAGAKVLDPNAIAGNMPGDSPALTETLTGGDAPAVTSAGTDTFDTTFPLVGTVSDFNRLPTPTKDESINYSSDAALKDIYAFYIDELGKQGLKERKINTLVSDKVVSLVMDGVDGGKSVVVQAVWLDEKKRNVNVRIEKLP
jgi:hypothetical protein